MKTWEKLKQNSKLWERYFVREKVIWAIREFFLQNGFHEVEIPLLIQCPLAESYLEVFETTLLDRQRRPTKAYLSTSPEMGIKKLLVAGLTNCFSLTKSFRNTETQSRTHNPEFTILEWYRVGVDYRAIMEDCEQLLLTILHTVKKGKPLIYQGKEIDLTPPWERLTVADSFQRYADIDFAEFLDEEQARSIARSKGFVVSDTNTWEELYNQISLNFVEPNLGRGKPTILYDYPAAVAALSRKKPDNPALAERFEFFLEGLELGDCYSELTDWKEQEERFKREIAEIKRLGKTLYEYDQDFIEALKLGLPECSGIAVGVDRLVMLFADTNDIAETMFFPAKEEFPLS